MKGKILILILAALLLTGCRGSGLGEKAIVNAVYLDRQGSSYTADLILTKTDPSADAGQVEEASSRVSGAGESLFAALADAESRENRETFYGLDEILLLGQGLSGGEVFEACRFLEDQAGGRPNVAVYRLDGAEDGRAASDEEDLLRLKSLEQLEKKGVFRAFLYDVAAKQAAVLPKISFREDFAALSGLELCSTDGLKFRWEGPKAELAALLDGQRRDLRIELPELRFTVRSPALTYEPQTAENGLHLSVCLYGRIDDLVSRSRKRQDDRELAQTINREMERLLTGLSAESFGRGLDVFRFAARLENRDAAGVRRLRREGLLYDADRISFDSQLHLI